MPEVLKDDDVVTGNAYLKEKDYEKAKEHYDIALKRGSYEAMKCLGDMYHYEDETIIDYEKAKIYYEMAMKIDMKAANCIGELYYFGRGVDLDYRKAKEYYEMALGEGSISSMYSL